MFEWIVGRIKKNWDEGWWLFINNNDVKVWEKFEVIV